MASGQGPHFSQCLLLCILVSGARLHHSPQIRELAVSTDECATSERPSLLKAAEEALEKELQNPSPTTVQALMLLSILDCAQSNDARGWMRSGNY